jgi:hypothetical protein
LRLRAGSEHFGRAADRQTQYRNSLASRWLSGVLALEIAIPGWSAEDRTRNSPAHSGDEHSLSAVGRTPHPRRITQVGHRGRADHGSKVRGEVAAATLTRWKTFLYNHADGIASMDLFVVPTISFRLLYGLLILRHARRELLFSFPCRPRSLGTAFLSWRLPALAFFRRLAADCVLNFDDSLRNRRQLAISHGTGCARTRRAKLALLQ